MKNLTKNEKIKQTLKATKERRLYQTAKTFECKVVVSHLSFKQKLSFKYIFKEAKRFYNAIIVYSELIPDTDNLDKVVPKNDLKTFDTKVKEVQVYNPKTEEVEVRPIKYLSAQMKQGLLTSAMDAIKGLSILKNHGHKIGSLKFKSTKNSINLKQYGKTFKILNNKYVQIEKIGKIRVRGLNQFWNIPNIEIANAKLIVKADGYYINITVYIPNEDIVQPTYIGSEIGIDMGIKTHITLSNGVKVSCTVEESDKLKRLQKQKFRRRKGSNNRTKTNHKIAKEYQHLNNKKKDAANKVVHHLLQFKTVYMQDENLKGWHHGRFGKQVQHSILGRVKAKLINHPRVEVLSMAVPTTKYCPKCGNIHPNITLADRVYVCPACGYTNDRDIHSAQNMITMVKEIKAHPELHPQPKKSKAVNKNLNYKVHTERMDPVAMEPKSDSISNKKPLEILTPATSTIGSKLGSAN